MPSAKASLRAQILEVLDEIKDPCSCANGTPMGLTEMGLVGTLDISDTGAVAIDLCLTSPFCHMIGFFTAEAMNRVGALPGVTAVTLTGDKGLEWSPSRMSPAAQSRRAEHLRLMMERAS